MKPIRTIEALREYCRAYRLIHECSMEDEAPRRRNRGPNHAAAAKKYADYDPASSGCLSGSGESVSEGSSFVNSGASKVLAAIAGAVNEGLLDFSKLPTHAYRYLLDSGKYESMIARLVQELS